MKLESLSKVTTEKSNPLTKELSLLFETNPMEALELLVLADLDSIKKYSVFIENYLEPLVKKRTREGDRRCFVVTGQAPKIKDIRDIKDG